MILTIPEDPRADIKVMTDELSTTIISMILNVMVYKIGKIWCDFGIIGANFFGGQLLNQKENSPICKHHIKNQRCC